MAFFSIGECCEDIIAQGVFECDRLDAEFFRPAMLDFEGCRYLCEAQEIGGAEAMEKRALVVDGQGCSILST
jgi:hypothetical protein